MLRKAEVGGVVEGHAAHASLAPCPACPFCVQCVAERVCSYLCRCTTPTCALQTTSKYIVVHLAAQESECKAALMRDSLQVGPGEDMVSLYAEEDFSTSGAAKDNSPVVMFYDCKGNSRGTVFTPGGTFQKVLMVQPSSRLHVVLVGEDVERCVRRRASTVLGPSQVSNSFPSPLSSSSSPALSK